MIGESALSLWVQGEIMRRESACTPVITYSAIPGATASCAPNEDQSGIKKQLVEDFNAVQSSILVGPSNVDTKGWDPRRKYAELEAYLVISAFTSSLGLEEHLGVSYYFKYIFRTCLTKSPTHRSQGTPGMKWRARELLTKHHFRHNRRKRRA